RYDPPSESTGDTNLVTPGNNAISHISFCWDIVNPTTTTTEAETTTTEAETTTTEAEETTTTQAEETTTTVEDTTTTTIGDEVLPTVITTSTVADPTTTAADEVLDTHVLPFTGSDNDMLALLAGGLGLLGALVLASTRRMEEN
ncbi:MAG TPA: LPXTG cell wall anchor domain-containing protein, partial [Acidimicrobiia bacterium]|nr:LPXTG cell wall anchor domain-containing protein [Acidimicrobiia bacterium]